MYALSIQTLHCGHCVWPGTTSVRFLTSNFRAGFVISAVLYKSIIINESNHLNDKYNIYSIIYLSSLHIGLFCTICKSTLGPTRSLMLLSPYLIMVGRSSERPHAITFTSSGRPMGSNISGRNTPELPISIHLPRPGRGSWNDCSDELCYGNRRRESIWFQVDSD